ncbi:hypothetical protein, partial [Streptomyces radicis]
PRTLDGTTLHDHVIRHIDATAPPTRANPNPRPEHHLTVYTPDHRATYDAHTGHFIENTDGTPGFQRVNDVEYLLLTPEHRAIPVQQLTESTTRTRRTTPPDLGDTDLPVHMAFVPDRPGNPGSDASDGSGVPGPARHGMGDSNVELTELPRPVRLSGHDGRSTGTLTTPPGGGAPTLTRDGQPVATDDIRITDRAILIRTGTTTTFHHPHDGHFLANLHVHRDGPLTGHIAITRAGQPPLLIRLDGQPTDLHVHHTGPLTGHIAITRAGQPPLLVRLDGQPTDTLTTTPFGNNRWRVNSLGIPFAVIDDTGRHTHDITHLRNTDDINNTDLDEYLLTPLTGDRTPTLHQGDGTQLPHDVELLDGGFLAIHRSDTTTDIHDTLGSHHATLHRLPGDEHHELAVTSNTPPRVIGADGETVPGSRATPLPDVPAAGRPGGPLVIRDGSGGGVAFVPLGDRGAFVRIGDHTPHIVDDTGHFHPTVNLLDDQGHASDLFLAPPTGRADTHAALRGDGRLHSDDVHSTFGGNRVVVHTTDAYDVHGPDGTLIDSSTRHPGGPLGPGNHLDIADDGTAQVVGPDGTPVPNATAKPLDNGGYLVNTPGQHPGIVDTQGTHTHDVVRLHRDDVPHGWAALPLRGDDPFALTPEGEPWRELILDVDATGITRHAANTHATQFFDWTGNYLGFRLIMTDGRLAGHEIRYTLANAHVGDEGFQVLTADGQVVNDAHVTRLEIGLRPGDTQLLVTIPGRDLAVINSGSGNYVYDAVVLPPLPGRDNGTTAVWPTNGSGPGALYDDLGRMYGPDVRVSDGLLAVTYYPRLTRFHHLDGTWHSTVRSGQGYGSFSGYRFELTELPDGTMTAQVIQIWPGVPVADVTLRPFGAELNMVDAPGVGHALLEPGIRHTHTVVDVPGAQDRLVALPNDTYRTGPSDDFWMDGAALRVEGFPDATFHTADGTVLGHAHRIPDGPLADNILAVPHGDTPFVVRPDGTPLPGAPVRPLELDGQFLIDVPGGGHITLNRNALSDYEVVPLPGRDGNPTNELALVPINEFEHAPVVVRTDRLGTDGAMTPAPYVTVRTSSETAEGADGATTVHTLEIITGPLASFRIVDVGDGTPRLLGPGDHPVPRATVTPLGNNTYAVRPADGSYAITQTSLSVVETTRQLSGPLSRFYTVLPEGGGLPHVADGFARPVQGAHVEHLATDMFLIEVDNVGRQVVNGMGAHTHDAVRLANPDGTPGDTVVAHPLDPDGEPTVHRGGRDISDDAWFDDDKITVKSGPHTTEHTLDGTFLNRVTQLTGPLDDLQILDTGPTNPLHLVDAQENPVPGTITPLTTGERLISDGDTRYLANNDGVVTHRVTLLTGRSGHPDLLALTGPDGQLYPLPRTLDGTTLHDHVIRHIDATAPPTRANPNPRPEHH